MNDVDILIGGTQRSLSRWTLALIAFVVAALLLLPLFTAKPIDSTVEKLLVFVLGALTSNWATQNGFWFGRPRSAGVPDPTVTTTTVDSNPPSTVTVRSETVPTTTGVQT